MHYYKFNISDWSLGTSHLNLAEEAIYFRLLNYYYDTEKPIPLETHSVFRRLRFGSSSDSANEILREFFHKTEKGWINLRGQSEIKEYHKNAKRNRANGKKGGRPCKIKATEETQGKPSGLLVGTQDEPKHNPNITLTTNYKPLTNNHKPITNNTCPTPSEESDDSQPKISIEEIYQAYPRKVQKPNAIKAITKALKSIEAEKLLQLTKDYAEARKGCEQRFTPHPASWFNAEGYNDSPDEWNPSRTFPAKPITHTENGVTFCAGRSGSITDAKTAEIAEYTGERELPNI